jgi:hypothetical protein
MKVPILFAVSIFHPYYGQSCQDFSFVIPTDSHYLLKNGQLTTRIIDGKLYVLLTNVTDQDLFSLAGKTLRIGLKLLNPFFSNFTDLDFDLNIFRPLYKNSINSNTLIGQPVMITGHRLVHVITSLVRPIKISLKDVQGHVFQSETITGANDRASTSYDLTGYESGLYTVEEVDTNSTKDISYYSDLELQSQGIFGFIEITVTSSFYTTPPEFIIPFVAKQEILKYYVVAQHYDSPELNKLSISDAGEAGRSTINFIPAVFTDDDISPSLFGNGDTKVALFKSQTAVARQEKARQKIQLKKNGDVLIPNLPQPRVDRAKSDLIVQVSKPKP